MADITLTEGISHAISEGADVLTSALTKIVCGNGTTLGGAIIDSGRYDWGGGRFPELSEPCPTYNNISFTETFGPQALITALRAIGLRDLGTGLSPLNAYEMIKGLETLDLRAHAISDRTRELAEWLEANPKVAWVRYPTLPSHDQSDLCRTLLGGFGGGILTFAPKGGYHAARKVTESTRLFTPPIRTRPIMLGQVTLSGFTNWRGESIPSLTLTYQVAGPALGAAPIVLVCHALTGNSAVAGPEGWWAKLIGPGQTIDTTRYTILSIDIPGNEYAGSAPLDDPSLLSVRDVARLWLLVLRELRVDHLYASCPD